MSVPILIVAAAIVVVGILLFNRRDRARRVAFDSAPAATTRKRTERRIGQAAARRGAVEASGSAPARAVEATPEPRTAAPWGPSPDPSAVFLAPDALAEVFHALAGGHKIMAIKLVREQTGLGLKDAKEFVEQLERDRPA